MHTFSEGYRISASVILTIENGLNSAIDWSKCRCLIRVHTYTTYITITCLKKKCNITLRGSDSLWKSVVSFDTCVFLWPASSNPNNQWRFKMNFAVKKFGVQIWCPLVFGPRWFPLAVMFVIEFFFFLIKYKNLTKYNTYI